MRTRIQIKFVAIFLGLLQAAGIQSVLASGLLPKKNKGQKANAALEHPLSKPPADYPLFVPQKNVLAEQTRQKAARKRQNLQTEIQKAHQQEKNAELKARRKEQKIMDRQQQQAIEEIKRARQKQRHKL